jgi:hypothetical protein
VDLPKGKLRCQRNLQWRQTFSTCKVLFDILYIYIIAVIWLELQYNQAVKCAVPYWAMSSAMLCLRAQVIPTTRTQKFPGEDRRTAAHSSSCCASTSLVTITNGPRAQTCEEPQSQFTFKWGRTRLGTY